MILRVTGSSAHLRYEPDTLYHRKGLVDTNLILPSHLAAGLGLGTVAERVALLLVRCPAAEVVVLGSLLGVAQHLVGFGYFLEEKKRIKR